MYIQILLLILGFIILIKGAEFIIDGSVSIAKHYNISMLIISIIIVGFGTNLPEFMISIRSMIANKGDIVFNNIVGSNIFNILFIIGISSLINPISIKNHILKKELPFVVLMSVLFSILFLDNLFENNTVSNYISRSEGITIVLFFLIFIYYIIQVVQSKSPDKEYKYKDDDIKVKYNISKAIPFTIMGLILVIVGAELVVENTALVAKALGLSERIITLFIIVPGTSLPEIVTSFMSVSRKQYDLVVGNVIGSNIFNIGLALGLPAAVFGNVIPTQFRYLDLITLILSSIMFYLFARNDRKIKVFEGITMIILFLIYYFSVVFI